MAKKSIYSPFWEKYKPFILLGFLLVAIIATFLLAGQSQEIRSRADTSTQGLPPSQSSGCCETDGQCKEWFGPTSSCTNGNGACASQVQCRGGAPVDQNTGSRCTDFSCTGKACGEKICGGVVCMGACKGDEGLPGQPKTGTTGKVRTNCNANGVCESNNNENSTNCKDDCNPAPQPVGGAGTGTTSSNFFTQAAAYIKAQLVDLRELWNSCKATSAQEITACINARRENLPPNYCGATTSCADGVICSTSKLPDNCGNCASRKSYPEGTGLGAYRKCGTAPAGGGGAGLSCSAGYGEPFCQDKKVGEACGANVQCVRDTTYTNTAVVVCRCKAP